MNKKILIVCKKFYPDNSPRSFRSTELAKEFARKGHDVTVLTLRKDQEHNEFEKKNNIIIKDIGKFKWRVLNFGNSSFGLLLAKAINYFLLKAIEFPDIELMFLLKKVLKNYNGFDLLISIAVPYPIHWGVAAARTKKHSIAKVWIADCGDPYMMNRMKGFGRFFYMKYFEKWYSRKADYVAITNISFIHNYYEEFHHKIVEIPQGFNFDEINVAKESIVNRIPTFAFAGALYKKSRNPSKFLHYLKSFNKPFKFVLYARNFDFILPILKELDDKIELRNVIPREQLIIELSKMDFLINFEFDPKVQSPSKLIDYYLTGRPVLNINSENFDCIAIDEFLDGNYSRQFVFGDMRKYEIRNVSSQFLKYAQ